jgi:hypothetical protein
VGQTTQADTAERQHIIEDLRRLTADWIAAVDARAHVDEHR